eukprot:2823636-Pleurochrysis_carterae.AAC.3
MTDPESYPGLAHFCEHMLFLGTEKFPDESDFERYVANAAVHTLGSSPRREGASLHLFAVKSRNVALGSRFRRYELRVVAHEVRLRSAFFSERSESCVTACVTAAQEDCMCGRRLWAEASIAVQKEARCATVFLSFLLRASQAAQTTPSPRTSRRATISLWTARCHRKKKNSKGRTGRDGRRGWRRQGERQETESCRQGSTVREGRE